MSRRLSIWGPESGGLNLQWAKPGSKQVKVGEQGKLSQEREPLSNQEVAFMRCIQTSALADLTHHSSLVPGTGSLMIYFT
jgi:hypothetical protein